MVLSRITSLRFSINIIVLSFLIPACNGFNWYHDIEKVSCSQSHVAVLNSFIINSMETINTDMDIDFNGSIDPLELGWQLWEEGRLIHWICSDVPSPYYIDGYSCGLSGNIPDEINNLDMLIKLHIDGNNLEGDIPESICMMSDLLFDSYWLKMDRNMFCPPYPSCIETIVGAQSSGKCKDK